jgi:hypothetical protein
MIGLPSNTRVWIIAGHTDMRKGFDGLAAMGQTALAANSAAPQCTLADVGFRRLQGLAA